jgi:hypothetical protein
MRGERNKGDDRREIKAMRGRERREIKAMRRERNKGDEKRGK